MLESHKPGMKCPEPCHTITLSLTRHELVLIHVIFVEVVADVLNEMRHGALKTPQSK